MTQNEVRIRYNYMVWEQELPDGEVVCVLQPKEIYGEIKFGDTTKFDPLLEAANKVFKAAYAETHNIIEISDDFSDLVDDEDDEDSDSPQ